MAVLLVFKPISATECTCDLWPHCTLVPDRWDNNYTMARDSHDNHVKKCKHGAQHSLPHRPLHLRVAIIDSWPWDSCFLFASWILIGSWDSISLVNQEGNTSSDTFLQTGHAQLLQIFVVVLNMFVFRKTAQSLWTWALGALFPGSTLYTQLLSPDVTHDLSPRRDPWDL